MVDYFPGDDGPARDLESIKAFIKALFLDQLSQNERERVYPFYTCATGRAPNTCTQIKILY